MASRQNTVDAILEQIAGAGVVSARKMFGEFTIYCDEKVVAIVADDQLFIKPTAAGKAFIGDFVEGCPYPGAKPSLLIPPEKWDDRPWMTRLVSLTAAELPPPGAKTSRRKTRA